MRVTTMRCSGALCGVSPVEKSSGKSQRRRLNRGGDRQANAAQLALAQLHQGDAEQATVTASDVLTIMGTDPLPGRMRTLIGDFPRGLFALSPSASYARDWADCMRTEWCRA